MSSVIISGDTSGSVTLQAPATAGNTTLTLPAVSGTVLQSGTTVTEAQGGTGTTGGFNSFKNRIINGDMRIDQRNAGAATTLTASALFPIDRFYGYNNNLSATLTAQQSSVAPSGFTKSLLFTVTTGAASGASDYAQFRQTIEGYNTTDLDFGLSTAKTVTVSFWVRSSVTGTYGFCIMNADGSRSYISSYTINTANSWEQKIVSIPGDTGGTWNTTNGGSLMLCWDLGIGSNNSISITGAWQTSAFKYGLTGGTKLINTTGATFYITGVQLEKGATATSFDYRPFGTELQLCQRYCWSSYTASGNGGPLGTGAAYNTTLTQVALQLPVSMRTTPSATTVANGSSIWCQSYVGATGTSTNLAPSIQSDSYNYQNLRIAIDGLSGMTAGQATWTFTAGGAKLILSAEL